jgi:hypothetical protein
MPGSVTNASATTVLPESLCSAFARAQEYAIRANDYPDGSNQRSLLVATSRKSWKLAKKLTATELSTLRAFYQSRNGPHQAFYFYDPFETDPLFSYDESGQDLDGRHIVRFDGDWEQNNNLGRKEVTVSLVELA